jgi:hypothetical protein
LNIFLRLATISVRGQGKMEQRGATNKNVEDNDELYDSFSLETALILQWRELAAPCALRSFWTSNFGPL